MFKILLLAAVLLIVSDQSLWDMLRQVSAMSFGKTNQNLELEVEQAAERDVDGDEVLVGRKNVLNQ